MKRSLLLDYIKNAGYNNDMREFMRLYVEKCHGKISYESATQAYKKGAEFAAITNSETPVQLGTRSIEGHYVITDIK